MRMFRKVGALVFQGFGPANDSNKKIVRLATRAEFDGILDDYRRWRLQFLDDSGQLKPGSSSPADAGFVHAGPRRTQREQIPVPKPGRGLVKNHGATRNRVVTRLSPYCC